MVQDERDMKYTSKISKERFALVEDYYPEERCHKNSFVVDRCSLRGDGQWLSLTYCCPVDKWDDTTKECELDGMKLSGLVRISK